MDPVCVFSLRFEKLVETTQFFVTFTLPLIRPSGTKEKKETRTLCKREIKRILQCHRTVLVPNLQTCVFVIKGTKFSVENCLAAYKE